MRLKQLLALAAIGALTFAGCSSGDSGSGASSGASTGSDTQTSESAPPAETSTTTDVEVFTWWTSGSEALGLEALQGVLATKYPDVTFINGGVTGGGGSAKELLQTRLQAGDPPDSFQVHAGAEAQDYIAAGQVTDVSYLYDEFGLTNVFPSSLIDLLTSEGKIYTIPSNVHRANVLWASVSMLEKCGLSTTDAYYKSVAEFIAALDTCQAAGVDTPLAVGNTWTQVHLMETILIGDLGGEAYNGLFDGTTDWASAEVTAALKDFATLMGYTNADRDTIDWEPATQKVLDGEAVFNIMGDWVPALLDSNNLVAGTDYLYAPSPGTEGVFDFLADSFSLTVGAPHPDGAKAWLDVISSVDGQIAFNKVKGSIPARTDIDLKSEGFSDYQQSSAAAFADNLIVGSIQHGAAATIAQGNAANAAVSEFTTSAMGDAEIATLQAALVAAFA
ncbi:MAG: ABC transporter substrate-binding protein [Propionibacteriaceae bacterium]|jgi:glucose/mannose transport system substrate-binding protein|nr:ABC transporter substrate-binding protein [Propionibacteriaceae bacterium]